LLPFLLTLHFFLRTDENSLAGGPYNRKATKTATIVDKTILLAGQSRLRQKEKIVTSDYTTAYTVDQTPEEVFAAINNVRGWWSGNIEGNTDKLGDEWTYRYEDIHYSKQKIVELTPGRKVVWRVLDGYLKFVEDKTEWAATTITFDIAQKDDKTELRFTHVGLVPEVECYGACTNAWSFYINDSLRSLITTGKGEPNEP
jgi:hypothetical protein